MLTFTSVANAAITDGKFGTAQIFDVQWYINGTGQLVTSGYTYIYKSSGGISQFTSSDYAAIDAANQYFAFFDSTTDPGTYGMALYNSDGTLNQVIHNTGTFTALADGAIFYNGDGSWGTLITTAEGYALGDANTFDGVTLNPNSTHLANWEPDSATPLADGQTAAPAGPTYVNLNNTITSVYPTSTNTPTGEEAIKAVDGSGSTKYLNFDRETAGFTVKLSTGRVVKALQFTTANDYELRDPTKFTLYGSNDGVTWTAITEEQAITLPNSRGSTTDPITITNTTAYVYYFITFPELKSTTDPSCANPTTQNEILACDSVQIAEVIFLMEDGDATTSTDQGSGTVSNPGPQEPVYVSSISTTQATTKTNALATTTGNLAIITIIGNDNDVDVSQLTNGNYADLEITGSRNVVDITQTSNVLDRHFVEMDIIGDDNTFTLLQSGDEKTAFISSTGDNNVVNITQQGTGMHFLDLTNTGDDALITILQEGTGNHSATLNLENGGGSWVFDLTQSGSTDYLYSLPHNLTDNTVITGMCYSGTCNMSIVQQ
jgi:hypothetical protein